MPLDVFLDNVDGDSYTLPRLPNIEGILRHEKILAIDIETKDAFLQKCGPSNFRKNGKYGPEGSRIIGIALALSEASYYFPIAHESGENMNEDNVINWFRDLARATKNRPIKIVFHNAQYDLTWLRHPYGIHFGKDHQVKDTMMMGALLNEYESVSLNSCLSRYLGLQKNENYMRANKDLFDIEEKAVKSEMYRMAPKFVSPYGASDAADTRKLFIKMEELIIKEGLEEVYNTENTLISMCNDMRHQGVRVDLNSLDQLSDTLVKSIKELSADIKNILGFECVVNSNQSMQKAFEYFSIPYDKTDKKNTKTGKQNGSFDSKKLEQYKSRCTSDKSRLFIDKVLEVKKCLQYQNLFIRNLQDKFLIDDMIYPSWVSTKSEKHNKDRDGEDSAGTKSGRLAGMLPNMMQIPNVEKDPKMGALIRSLFLPEKGSLWGAFDYSQQEPRIAVHYSSLWNLTGAEEALNFYKMPDADFYNILSEMSKTPRKQAKVIFLALLYSMGKLKLCKTLGFPTKKEKKYERNSKKYVEREVPGMEGEELFKVFHERVPFIKELTEKCSRMADMDGFIRTLSGRKSRFPFFEAREFSKRLYKGENFTYEEAFDKFGEDIVRANIRKATNSLVQGAAADMTKAGMVGVYKEGYLPIVTVHDELGFSIRDYKEVERIVEIMTTCVDLRVPARVDFEMGLNWGRAVRNESQKKMDNKTYFYNAYSQLTMLIS